eukprot:CAMPEP_0170548502 /NCGR_PEP_ID=MMETSP0211-20121228/6816_1 /TAXON_ID=311385 /ORGANISM="Pseudokeronopsis sp., Strain OXSARD2" /LENGTH=49 /DNA_ID=CAMNT_0010854093 /DNA_START=196 /DNA_END=345 /DNA_ORIENTATION=+
MDDSDRSEGAGSKLSKGIFVELLTDAIGHIKQAIQELNSIDSLEHRKHE